MTGKLYGIGIGPGDPGLVTLKAKGLLERVDVICLPRASSGEGGIARQILEGLLSSPPPLLELDFPMVRDRARLREYWGRAAGQVSRLLGEGKEVAFITLGDPLLYSTYNYLLQALREKHPDLEVETVPGVSSISAAAALAGLPLAQGGERLAILPAPPDGEGLREVLARFDTVVVMKVGDRLPALRRALEELGLAGKAVLVSRVGLEGQRVVRGLQSLKDNSVGYLSVVIIRRSEG